MQENIKVGKTYIGSVTGEKFTILEIKKRYLYAKEEEIWLLYSKFGKTTRASIPLIQRLIKSNGLITDDNQKLIA